MLAAESGPLARANAAGAACAAAALAAGLVLRLAPAVPVAVALLAAGYAALLGLEGETLDARAPLVAAALLATSELAYWSLELRPGLTDEAGASLRRLSLLAGLALAVVTLGTGLLALAEGVAASGSTLVLLGAAAAVGAVGLLALAARRV